MKNKFTILVATLLVATTEIHKLHFKVTGPGSYAQHMTLCDLYSALPDHVDTLVEQYQGRTGTLIDFSNTITPVRITSVEECIMFIDNTIANIDEVEGLSTYSEINNLLDEVKSTLNIARYKLLFLA